MKAKENLLMPKKILIVTDLFLKRFDTSVEQIKSFIKECNNRGIVVQYVIPQEPCQLVKDFLSVVDFHYTVVPCWWDTKDIDKRNNIKIAVKVFNIIKKNRINLVEFNFCYEETVFIIAILCKLNHLKPALIWRQHSGSGFNKDNFIIMFLKKILSKLKVLSWVIDYLIVLSERQKTILVGKRISGSKILVLPNGVNCDRFKTVIEREKIFKDFGVVPLGKIIVTIATLTPVKGIVYLINAAKIVIRKFPDTKFLIVGEGYLLESLMCLVAESGIKENIYFLGRRNDVEEILSASDIFVLPSISEAFPFSIVEAMAAGKPVVATDVGANSEIILNNKSGLLVVTESSCDLADAISMLLSDNDLMKSMGKVGREIVENNFQMDQVVSKYIDIYEDIIDKNMSEKYV